MRIALAITLLACSLRPAISASAQDTTTLERRPWLASIPATVDFARLYRIPVGDHFGYIDSTGAVVVPLVLGMATNWNGETVTVADTARGRDDMYCFLDRRGAVRFGCFPTRRSPKELNEETNSQRYVYTSRQIFRPDGTRVPLDDSLRAEGSYRNGYLVVSARQTRYSYVDTGGRLLLTPQFENAAPFEESLPIARVRTPGGFGYITTQHSFAIEPGPWDDRHFSAFHDGVAMHAGARGCRGLVDTTGRLRFALPTPPASQDWPSYSCEESGSRSLYGDGLWQVTINRAPCERSVVFLTSAGRIAVRSVGQSRHFAEGRALTRQCPRDAFTPFGYIDQSGAYVIAPRFTEAEDFSRGLAWVKEAGRGGWINRSGQYVWRESLLQH